MQINSESINLHSPQALRGGPGHIGRNDGPAQTLAALAGSALAGATTFQSPTDLDQSREPITLEGLQRAWGTSTPQYDLNGDGTVNMGDLLEFLAQQPKPTDPESSPSDASQAPSVTSDADDSNAGDDVSKLTKEGFDEAWGTDDTNYDLNGDGIVNMTDLLAFLSQSQPAAEPESDELTTTPGVLTEEGFEAAWGTSDANYDLNGDGTVNMVDLLSFLDQQNQEQSGGNGVPGGDPPSLLEQFHDAWGSDDPQFDLNGDGTVNMSDLLAFLAQLGGGGDAGARQAAEGAGATSPVAASGIDPERLGQSIVSRFEAAGFLDRPPTNARQIVGGLGLDDLANRLIIEHLTSRYPDGLKLDVMG
jgi:Ca2+-binding EF-hand superfamily protein